MTGSFNAGDYVGVGSLQCFRLIQSHIEGLIHYGHLKSEVLNMLENPELKILEQVDGRTGERLFEAGLIANAVEFQNYMDGLAGVGRIPSFIEAPGSRMGDHHSYPGGLTYHTAADIELALGMAHVYQTIYQLKIDKEVLIITLALHDIAKATVFSWNGHGEYPGEIKTAGTEGHHILSVAEAVCRSFPFPIIKAIAFCHNRVVPPEKGLEEFLQAAYIVAGKKLPDASLRSIAIEDWICLNADSDWMISGWANQRMVGRLREDNLEVAEIRKRLASGSEFVIFR